MRVAVVPGPIPGTPFPAIALWLQFLANGIRRHVDGHGMAGYRLRRRVDAMEQSAWIGRGGRRRRRGAKISQRARGWRNSHCAAGRVRAGSRVSRRSSHRGRVGADLLGLPWVELKPPPAVPAVEGLPPLGSGLAPEPVSAADCAMRVRALTARSWREGQRQRGPPARVEIGLPPSIRVRDGG